MIRRLKIAGLILWAIALIVLGGAADAAARLTRSFALRAIADDLGGAHDRTLIRIEGLLK
jgi:hypothetical protein